MKIECSICLDEITPPNNLPIAAAKCGHLFHKGCINNWVVKHSNCPQCRAPCKTDQLRDIFFNNYSDRRKSDIFNMTIVKDMNELQEQLLSEQDTLIETNNKLQAEVKRLREQNATNERKITEFIFQLKNKDGQIAALKNENTRTRFTNQIYKHTIQKGQVNIKTEND